MWIQRMIVREQEQAIDDYVGSDPIKPWQS